VRTNVILSLGSSQEVAKSAPEYAPIRRLFEVSKIRLDVKFLPLSYWRDPYSLAGIGVS
jgi:hypothetical protein